MQRPEVIVVSMKYRNVTVFEEGVNILSRLVYTTMFAAVFEDKWLCSLGTFVCVSMFVVLIGLPGVFGRGAFDSTL